MLEYEVLISVISAVFVLRLRYLKSYHILTIMVCIQISIKKIIVQCSVVVVVFGGWWWCSVAVVVMVVVVFGGGGDGGGGDRGPIQWMVTFSWPALSFVCLYRGMRKPLKVLEKFFHFCESNCVPIPLLTDTKDFSASLSPSEDTFDNLWPGASLALLESSQWPKWPTWGTLFIIILQGYTVSVFYSTHHHIRIDAVNNNVAFCTIIDMIIGRLLLKLNDKTLNNETSLTSGSSKCGQFLIIKEYK